VHSLAPQRLLTLLVPYLFGNPLEDLNDWGWLFAPRFALVRSLYLGVLPLVLIPIAVATARERRALFFAGVLVVSLVLALGNYTPFYELAYAILPALSKFRYPVKVFFATSFAASVLTGYGIQCLFSRGEASAFPIRRNWAAFTKWFLIAFMMTAAAWFIFALCDRFVFGLTDGLILRASTAEAPLTQRFIPYMKNQMLHASLMLTALGLGLWSFRRGVLSVRSFVVFLILFVGLDLLGTNYRAMATIPRSFYTPPRIDSVLRSDPEPHRLYRTPLNMEQNIQGLDIKDNIEYYLWNREILSPNFGTLFGHAYTDGYESANLLWHNLFIRFVEEAPPLIRPRLLGLVNVKYIFSSHPLAHPDLRLKTSLTRNVFLYENSRCLERAYFVPDALVVRTEGDALAVMASELFNPHEAVVLVDRGGPGSLNPQAGVGGFEVAFPSGFSFRTMDVPEAALPGQPPVRDETSNPVRILSYSPHSISLSLEAPLDGYAVLCDAYYPKWRATVNRVETNVLRANCTVRAVRVQKGNNSIEFSYDSDSFRRAAWVSLATLALCVGGIIFEVVRKFMRRSRRASLQAETKIEQCKRD
jgi:hypothetical protein